MDDAIVIIENIHRHYQQGNGGDRWQSALQAVSEVGNPTILATFTVISALVPTAFVTGMTGVSTGGSDAGSRGLRYLEWRWVPESSHETYVTDMAYLLRDERGAIEVFHDRHVMGLFSRAVWMELIAAAGFEPLAVPFEHSSFSNTGHEVFLGLRPTSGEEA